MNTALAVQLLPVQHQHRLTHLCTRLQMTTNELAQRSFARTLL